jgi:hypothetical protein
MKLVGFNYTKIEAERLESTKKFESVAQSLNFIELTKDEIDLMKESNVLKASFEHTIKYEPGFAKIILQGTVLLQAEATVIKEAVKSWKKDKKIIDEIKIPLYKIILNRCALKSLNLEEALNVPHHMNLVNIKNN